MFSFLFESWCFPRGPILIRCNSENDIHEKKTWSLKFALNEHDFDDSFFYWKGCTLRADILIQVGSFVKIILCLCDEVLFNEIFLILKRRSCTHNIPPKSFYAELEVLTPSNGRASSVLLIKALYWFIMYIFYLTLSNFF